MRDIGKGKRLQLLLGVPQHLLIDGIGGNKAAIQVCESNADRGVLKNRPPSFLAAHDLCMSRTQGVFASFALGDIAKVAGEGRGAVLRDARDRKFDRDFSPIGAERSHLKSPAQYFRVAGGQVAGEPVTVFLPERRRDDDIGKMPAQHIAPSMAEGLFRRRVELRNAPFVVNGYDAIR